MGYDRKHLILGFVYAMLGMILGIVMAATNNHTQHVTHAHILLVGLVLSFIYGATHRLWLDNGRSGLGLAQFIVHHVGAIAMSVGLYLLYGGIVAPTSIEPLLKVASLAVLLGLILMFVMVLRSRPSQL